MPVIPKQIQPENVKNEDHLKSDWKKQSIRNDVWNDERSGGGNNGRVRRGDCHVYCGIGIKWKAEDYWDVQTENLWIFDLQENERDDQNIFCQKGKHCQ